MVKKRISDVIFVVLTAILTAYFMINVVGGSLRWYVVITAFFGLILYFFTISRFLYILLSFFTKKMRNFLHFIFKFLLTVMQFLGKISLYIKNLIFIGIYRRGNRNDKDKI